MSVVGGSFDAAFDPAVLQVCSALLAVPFLALGAAKVAAVPAMRERAAHVGFTVSSYRAIGAAEVLAGLALLAARWWPVPALAALGGLVLLMVGAVVVHVRNGDPRPAWLPAAVLGALSGALTCALGAAVLLA